MGISNTLLTAFNVFISIVVVGNCYLEHVVALYAVLVKKNESSKGLLTQIIFFQAHSIDDRPTYQNRRSKDIKKTVHQPEVRFSLYPLAPKWKELSPSHLVSSSGAQSKGVSDRSSDWSG